MEREVTRVLEEQGVEWGEGNVADTRSNLEQKSRRRGRCGRALLRVPGCVCVVGTTQQNLEWGLLPSSLVFFSPPLPSRDGLSHACLLERRGYTRPGRGTASEGTGPVLRT